MVRIMIKDFITWLYAKYVVMPEFDEYLQDRPEHTRFSFEKRAYKEDEIAIAMVEKRFAPRVDH